MIFKNLYFTWQCSDATKDD